MLASPHEAHDSRLTTDRSAAIVGTVRAPRLTVSLAQPVVGVTGASGLLGRHVIGHLASAMPHANLIALSRRDPGLPHVRWRSCDFDTAQGPNLEGLDVLVHLAAEKRNAARMEQINVGGTRQLVEAMLAADVRRVIHLSSVGVYGAGSNAGVITEAFPRRPNNEYERTKAAAEALVDTAARKAGLELLVLQPSNVLAVDSAGQYPLLGFARAVARGRFAFIGQSPAILNYLSVRNVSAAIECGIRNRLTGVFILNTPIDLERGISVITQELNAPYPKRSVPRALAVIAGLGADVLAGITGRALPFSSSRVRELTNTTVFDGARASLLYGGAYPVSIETALADLMHEYRDAGLV